MTRKRKSNTIGWLIVAVFILFWVVVIFGGTKDKEAKDIAEKFDNKVDRLPYSITYDDIDTVKQLDDEYYTLSDREQSYVTTRSTLDNYLSDIDDLVAKQEEINRIDSLFTSCEASVTSITDTMTLDDLNNLLSQFDDAEKQYKSLSYNDKKSLEDSYKSFTSSKTTLTVYIRNYKSDNGIVTTEGSATSGNTYESTEEHTYTEETLSAEAQAFKDSCITVSYNDLLTNPDLYKLKPCKIEVTIDRVDPDGIIFQGTNLAHSGKSSNIIGLYDDRLVRSPRYTEGQTLTLYGYGDGLAKLKSSGLGGTLSDIWSGDPGESVPAFSIRYTSLDNYSDWILLIDDNKSNTYYDKGAQVADSINSFIGSVDNSLTD